MMTSSQGNAYCVTSPLWGESTGHWWIPLTKANRKELWCFLWCMPKETVEQTVELLVIWDAMSVMWCHCNAYSIFKFIFHKDYCYLIQISFQFFPNGLIYNRPSLVQIMIIGCKPLSEPMLTYLVLSESMMTHMYTRITWPQRVKENWSEFTITNVLNWSM